MSRFDKLFNKLPVIPRTYARSNPHPLFAVTEHRRSLHTTHKPLYSTLDSALRRATSELSLVRGHVRFTVHDVTRGTYICSMSFDPETQTTSTHFNPAHSE